MAWRPKPAHATLYAACGGAGQAGNGFEDGAEGAAVPCSACACNWGSQRLQETYSL